MSFDKALRDLPGGKAINIVHEGRTMGLLFSELNLAEEASDLEILLSVGAYLLKSAEFMQGFLVERSEGMVRIVPKPKAPEADAVFPGVLEDSKPNA